MTHADAGANTANPIIDDLVTGWDSEEEEVFYRAVCDTEMLFIGDDYTYLKGIEDSANRCTDVVLTVTVACGAGSVTRFTGLIKMNSCTFDVDKCQVRVTPDPNDNYTDLFLAWEDEVNILSGTDKTTVKTFLGEIEVQRCPETGFDDVFEVFPSSPPENDSCLSNPSAGWTMIRNYFKSLIPSVSGPPGTYDGVTYTYWAREKVTGASGVPPGSGWVNLGGGTYVRPLPVEFNYDEFVQDPAGVGVLQTVFNIAGVTTTETGDVSNVYEFEAHEYDNGVHLAELLDALVPSGWSVVSDFYSINPDSTNPANAAYTAAQEDYADLVWYQMTDITNWNATQNATKALTTLKEVYEQLKTMDDIRLFIPSDTVVRIEHISYFSKSNGIDTTVAPHGTYNDGKRQYSYDVGDLPKYEKFVWLGSPVSDYFEGDPIEYTTCLDENSGTQDRSTARVCTDIGFINNNVDRIGTDGFVVVASAEYEGENYIIQGGGVLNGRMSRTYKHDKFWRHERYQATGKINGASVTFESFRRSKTQEAINAKLNCSQLDSFDPNDFQKTEFGWGEVVEARYSAKNCLLTSTLKHE
jgi:hypothetical protein